MHSFWPLVPQGATVLQSKSSPPGKLPETMHFLTFADGSSGTASVNLSVPTTKEMDFKTMWEKIWCPGEMWRGENSTGQPCHLQLCTPSFPRTAPSLSAALPLRAVLQGDFLKLGMGSMLRPPAYSSQPPHPLLQHPALQKGPGEEVGGVGAGGAELKCQPHHLLTE